MDFDVNGNTYRSAKLGAKQQFHLARRLGPILASLSNQQGEAHFFTSIASAVAEMSDENCDYILDTCMSVVARQQGSAWSKIFNERGHTMQFDDIDMSAMLQIARYVIEDNLGNFFGALRAQNGSEVTTTE